MNRERMRVVLAHIEQHRDQFNMWDYYRETKDCGAVACIAGWTSVLYPLLIPQDAVPSWWYEGHPREGFLTNIDHLLSARTILDLTPGEAMSLFDPDRYSQEDGDPSVEDQAIERLREWCK